MIPKKSAIVLFITLISAISSAPAPKNNEKNRDLEDSLDRFLNLYYQNYVKNNQDIRDQTATESVQRKTKEKSSEDDRIDIYETMQGDEPVTENAVQNQNANFGLSLRNNISNADYIRTMKERVREQWIQAIKHNILIQLGREENATVPKMEETQFSKLNMTVIIPTLLNSSTLKTDDQITEKIRSFYPSCDVPGNTDQDLWKDDDTMNLFFNFDYDPDNKNSNIATATLRLYRLPYQNGTKLGSKKDDCDTVTYNMEFLEEDKLLRVSIYWYTKPLKKRRGAVKRRLCDSKMVSETSRWVELSVKPATKAWTKGRNLGLAVLVEDQDGNMLRADKYFKGASCTQPPNQFQPLSSTQLEKPTNLTEFIAYVEEIQRQPFIVTYNCYQPSIFAP